MIVELINDHSKNWKFNFRLFLFFFFFKKFKKNNDISIKMSKITQKKVFFIDLIFNLPLVFPLKTPHILDHTMLSIFVNDHSGFVQVDANVFQFLPINQPSCRNLTTWISNLLTKTLHHLEIEICKCWIWNTRVLKKIELDWVRHHLCYVIIYCCVGCCWFVNFEKEKIFIILLFSSIWIQEVCFVKFHFIDFIYLLSLQV